LKLLRVFLITFLAISIFVFQSIIPHILPEASKISIVFCETIFGASFFSQGAKDPC
jgi:hypothetical protein